MCKPHVKNILEILSRLYPEARTTLDYENTFQLLIAVILSAQCSDRQVNKITRRLFQKYRTPEEFAGLTVEQLAGEIKSCGLYRNKSINIIATCNILVERYGSCVPASREELRQLPGVGRKSANVVLGVAFNQPTLPVDTHVFRVSHRLGLTRARTPEGTEEELLACIPSQYRMDFHHQLLAHGRQICTARKPKCARCQLLELCPVGNCRD
ncbi:MAG TPA: endonuclease III [Desulfotomaculum sp.]|jgi:endonuclease-3|nr:endonuclease III [Desulfotomaculum sp.]